MAGTGRGGAIERRNFLKAAAALPLLPLACATNGRPVGRTDAAPSARATASRWVHPGDPGWPPPEAWEALNRQVQGRLIQVESPLDVCRADPHGEACAELFRDLKNPYYIGDHPALTQTSGWLDAWTSSPSEYAVAAEETGDVVAAVNFAREHRVRLVVKGGGHSYQGTSNAPDSLLVWTRRMRAIELDDAFVPRGCDGRTEPQPAVTVGAGAIWMHVYQAVTPGAGRYVQGGGCATVGVAGLVQSGGFGSFSKRFGLAAAGLLEAEVVTADGAVRIANACTHPDLFWALKGGGGGTFGVVTRVTLRTRELPHTFGVAFGKIRARSDDAYRTLIAQFLIHYRDRLMDPHWGETVRFEDDNTLTLSMLHQGLSQEEAETGWRPFLDWIAGLPQDYQWEEPITIVAFPARGFWDPAFFKEAAPDAILTDDRPGAPVENIYWATNRGEAGMFLHAYRSAWMPASLLSDDRLAALVDALFAASRRWTTSLHFNKGLAGAPPEEIEAARDTAMNPAVLDAFALAIVAGEGPPAFAGIGGHEPDLARGHRSAGRINAAMGELLRVAPDSGSYLSESDYFETDWQRSYWGSNYPRLAEVKRTYDPAGLFSVHNGVLP
ncbi:MAG TPA: FAD-binding oxidoreductase [Gemmatimonadota bacterium]|nr:FAD-binding oxidoreductase [Gemmatimonadota bacterium]